MMTDPIADMLTRIRNALAAEKKTVSMPSSKAKVAIAEVLKSEGYILGYEVSEDAGKRTLTIELKYYMARLTPLTIPSGVDVNISGQSIRIKGSKGDLSSELHPAVEVETKDNEIVFAARDGADNGAAFAGTVRAIVRNMLVGVTEGFEKKLELVGVGYRARARPKWWSRVSTSRRLGRWRRKSAPIVRRSLTRARA